MDKRTFKPQLDIPKSPPKWLKLKGLTILSMLSVGKEEQHELHRWCNFKPVQPITWEIWLAVSTIAKHTYHITQQLHFWVCTKRCTY